MSDVSWDPHARRFLIKLLKKDSKLIFNKVNAEIRYDVERYLESLKDRKIAFWKMFSHFLEPNKELLSICEINF